ncbi:MAG: SelT/SelW/SelH family protein [Planctomycetota bacterium]|nr:Rdx family protein [Gemmataceae bacterium]NBS89867.1 SelT/SelW/SelH family protein [bacterium]NBT62165.1 SelT/SelW/SelH family protein [Planctomycetia bacterium]RLS59332.1 MAG: SelT/SelW/SelH family protein [Planctomycetota bacterium]MBJ7346008.1 Rdx family protein [Gemmataceae bacterium]
MTAKLLEHFKMQIVEMKLIPSSGGCFELTANGKLLYSKLAVGKFPEEELMLKQVEALIAEVK